MVVPPCKICLAYLNSLSKYEFYIKTWDMSEFGILWITWVKSELKIKSWKTLKALLIVASEAKYLKEDKISISLATQF